MTNSQCAKFSVETTKSHAYGERRNDFAVSRLIP